jgi:hypothetical protein
MKRCTQCGKEYPDNTNFCPIDGHPVIDPSNPPSAIPPPILLKSAAVTSADASQKSPEASEPLVDAPKKIADAPKKSAGGRYLKYADVPWYRREPGLLAMIGVLLCGFVTIALCLICLTGDVYKNRYDRDGNLEVWGISNKIAAVVILIIQGFILWLYHWQANQ